VQILCLAICLAAVAVQEARAALVPIGDAANYAVLYTGGGTGHQLSITNVAINGSVGVGGSAQVQLNGPGTLGGNLNFSAANTGQYHNTNGSNIVTGTVAYNVSAVTSDLNALSSLSSSLAGLGNNIALNGTETINESAGTLKTINGTTYRLFNVTSYNEGNGNVLTINGDGSGDPVVFNFGAASNVNLGGDVALTGSGLASGDKVLWNFTSTGKNISLNNNASSYPLPLAFQGIILAPNDGISLVNANIDGRVFGGDSTNMQIVSGDIIDTPNTNTVIPEPASFIVWICLGGIGLIGYGWRRRSAKRSIP
jgi:choice-of-anchor A domain-containing protein